VSLEDKVNVLSVDYQQLRQEVSALKGASSNNEYPTDSQDAEHVVQNSP